MKKLYFAITMLAVALASQATDKVTFYLGLNLDEKGEPKEYKEIAKGSKIEYNEITDGEIGGYQVKPPVYMMCDSQAKDRANLTVECTTGQSVQVCVGDNCQSGSKVEKKNFSLNANVKTDLALEYVDFNAESPADLPKNITLKISGHVGSMTMLGSDFTIVLNSDGASTATISGDKSEVRVSGGHLVYKIHGHAVLSLYNILGVRALQMPVSESGSINLSTLPKGIYVYTVEGDTNLSGKISR